MQYIVSNEIKEKNSITILINAEKVSEKFINCAHIFVEFLGKLGVEGKSSIQLKGIYKKTTTNDIFNARLNVYPLILGIKRGCTFSSLPFSIVMEIFASPI